MLLYSLARPFTQHWASLCPYLVLEAALELLLGFPHHAQLVVALAQAGLPPPVLRRMQKFGFGGSGVGVRRTRHWGMKVAQARLPPPVLRKGV